MAQKPHKTVARMLESIIDWSIMAMGLEREIINDGSAREISQNRKFIKEPGATFTPARVVEEIVATRESGVTKVTGDLTIPFEKLAARAANGPQECDTIVTKDQVSTICELAWAAQEFM
ncbi:hypothetical protein MaudCBS49596_007794 [Microsporum audouinii]